MVRQRTNEDLEAALDGSPTLAANGISASGPVPVPCASLQLRSTGGTSNPPYRTNERTPQELRDMFHQNDGQCLLHAFRSGRNGEERDKAVLVPVYRPSKHWALRMEQLEKDEEPLPVPVPEHEDTQAGRWRKIRGENRGEYEVSIWERVKLLHNVRRPSWHRWAPFFRYRLSERKMLLHSREGDVFKVDLTPGEPLEYKPEYWNRRAHDWAQSLSPPTIDARCPTDRDHFGEVFAPVHRQCRKAYYLRSRSGKRRVHMRQQDTVCYDELHDEACHRADLCQRRDDFLRCFRNPGNAKTVFPLTQGRAYESCIHQGDYIETLQLPDWRDVTQGPPTPPSILGFYIECEFVMKKHEVQMAGVGCTAILVILIWRFATDSWSIAAAFGSILLAFVGLKIQWKKAATEESQEDPKSTKKD